MAVTINTDFTIYEDEFHTRMVEVLQQNTAAFNEGSNGAIRLVDQASIGNFRKSTIFKEMTHIGRRVTTSVAAKVPTNLAHAERVSAKLHRSYMADTTRDSFRKIGADLGEFSAILGEQVGVEKATGFLNSAILTLRTVMENQPAITANLARFDHTGLFQGMRLFGDKSQNIRTWVLHSDHWHTLAQNAIADNVYNVAGVTINQGINMFAGRSFVVTDSPALVDGVNRVCLGLTENACAVLETEDDDVVTDVVTGQDNLIERIQGEYAFNVETKGFGWLEASGANPDDAAIAVAANYAQYATSHKMLPGVVIKAPA